MIINQNVRKFEIMGLSNGQIFNLNTDNYFLNLPKGLGIRFKNEYFRLGNLQIRTGAETEYQDISGNLLIKSYGLYENFRKFIAINRDAGFRLFYTPQNEILKRYVNCDLKEITKTELEQFGYLNCSIIITPKSAWLKDVSYEVNLIKSGTIGKRYPYTYPYKYSTTILEAELLNNGDFETPLEIILDGPMANPTLQLIDVNGQVVQSAYFEIDVNSGEKFIINSNPQSLEIYVLNVNNEKVDKTETQDFDKTTYITLPVGEYTLKINDFAENEITGLIKVKEEYLGA